MESEFIQWHAELPGDHGRKKRSSGFRKNFEPVVAKANKFFLSRLHLFLYSLSIATPETSDWHFGKYCLRICYLQSHHHRCGARIENVCNCIYALSYGRHYPNVRKEILVGSGGHYARRTSRNCCEPHPDHLLFCVDCCCGFNCIHSHMDQEQRMETYADRGQYRCGCGCCCHREYRGNIIDDVRICQSDNPGRKRHQC